MNHLKWASPIAVSVLLLTAQVALAQDTTQTGGTPQPPTPTRQPPPGGMGIQNGNRGTMGPPPSGMQGGQGEMNGTGTRPMPPKPMQKPAQNMGNQNQMQGQPMQQNMQTGQMDSGQSDAQSVQRDKMMLLQAKRMAKMLTAKLKILQTKTQKVQKAGLYQSTECIAAVAAAKESIATMNTATSADEIADMMQDTSLFTETMTCMREADQLLQGPAIMKTIPKMIARLKKASVDVATLQSDFDSTVVPAYAALKSASVSQDQIDEFFSAANDMRDGVQSAFDDAEISLSKELQGTLNGPALMPLQDRQSSSGFQNQLANIATAVKNFFGIR